MNRIEYAPGGIVNFFENGMLTGLIGILSEKFLLSIRRWPSLIEEAPISMTASLSRGRRVSIINSPVAEHHNGMLPEFWDY